MSSCPRFNPVHAVLVSLCALAPAEAQDRALDELANALIEAEIPSKDAPDLLVAELLTAAQSTSHSAASGLAIEAARRFATRLDHPEAQLQPLSDYLASEPHPLGKLAAEGFEYALERRMGRPVEAKLRRSLAGYASSMIAIGPFGDGGDFYTGVSFAPEMSFPDAGKTLAGRFGTVQSYLVKRHPWQSKIPLGRRGSTESGCYYGLHQLHCDRGSSAYLEVTCRGSFEIFINEHKLESVDRLAGARPDRIYFPVQLREGNNWTLIKTTYNREQRVGLRYVDARGASLRGCQEVSENLVRPLAAAGDLPALLPPFIDGYHSLRGAARDHPESNTIRIAAMFAAFEHGDEPEGIRLLTELGTSPPRDPRLRLALAHGYDMARALPQEIRRSRARSLLESMNPPLQGHFFATLLKSEFLTGEDKPEQAISLLKAELNAGRGGPQTFAQLVALTSRLSFEAERMQFLDAWRQAHPNDARPVLQLAKERDTKGDRQGACDLLLDFLARVPGESVVQNMLFTISVDIGRLDVAERMIAALAGDRPVTVPILRRKAMLAETRHASTDIIDFWHRIATHPEAGSAETHRAGLHLLRAGQEKAAVVALRRSLEQDSSQHGLRRLLSRLEQRGDDYPLIAHYRYQRETILEGFKAGPREQTAPSSLLLDQMIVRFYPDGARVEEIHQIRRINDLRGVEAYEQADQAAAAAEIINLQTIGRDGLSYLPTRVAGKYAMPRLEPGALIETEYRDFTDAPGPSPLRGPTFFFQGADAPFLLTELVVILPPKSRGSFRVRNFSGEMTEEDLADGYRAHIYRMRDVPRLLPELLIPDSQDILPVVAYGEDGSIGPISRARHASLRLRIRTNAILGDKVRELCAGLDDPQQKVWAIYDFVQRSIQTGRGSGSPTATLLRGQGNRFDLFITLVKASGMPMRLAAASQAHESLLGLPKPLFLGEDSYPLPAALLLPDSTKPIWTYASSPRYAPLGSIASGILDAPVLLLSLGGEEFSRLPAGDRRQGTGWNFSGELRLDSEGGAEFTTRSVIRGKTGLDLAEQIRMQKSNQRNLVGQNLAGQLFPGWTLHSAKIGDIEPGSVLSLRASMVRRSALSRAGKDLLLPLPMPPSALFSELGGPSDRHLPMRLTGMTHTTWDVVIDPGDEFRIVEIPSSQLLKHSLLDYQLSYTMEASKLRIRRILTRRPGRLPASAYSQWILLLRRIDLAETAQIKLRRKD